MSEPSPPAGISRRRVVQAAAASAAVKYISPSLLAQLAAPPAEPPLQEFGYHQVTLHGDRQLAQQSNAAAVLMSLDEDSLLKPFREMSTGQPAPGASLGGWYEWNPSYDHHHGDAGFAPASTFGQWTSALARLHAASTFPGATPRPGLAARVTRLHAGLAESISPRFFAQTRFPAYTLDKLVCGLMDAHRLLADPTAFATLDKVTSAALPTLPPHAIDREIQWKLGADISFMWDESYTLPENLFLVSAEGAGSKYRQLAETYLLDKTYFEPLSRGINALPDNHAYSYVNALCSAMQAWFVTGSAMHRQAAVNGFSMLQQQSFATGGWGPDELLHKRGYDEVARSLTSSHNSFETPCGSYAHMKLTRYLLRATRDGLYGDSMERIFHNTILGALPLQQDGRSFYSADYNIVGKRVYSTHRWPCCSGTYPQVVADYGINTFLHSPGAVWVNLYHPSELRWSEAGRSVSLLQTGAYPNDGAITLRLTTLQPIPLAIHLRIPAWAAGAATLKVNGKPAAFAVEKGFTTVSRVWRTGDRIDLDLPMPLRLEPIPSDGAAAHPNTVALLRGPIVLFPVREPTDTSPLSLPRESLLNAERTGLREWTVITPTGPRRLLPFPEIGDRTYTTYVTAT